MLGLPALDMREAVAKALVVAAISAFPLAAYVTASRKFDFRAKCIAVAVVLAIGGTMAACAPGTFTFLTATTLGFAYFLLLAPVVYVLGDLVAAERMSRPALLFLLAGAFIVVPGVLAPFRIFWPVELRGWELMFAGYSFCADRKANPKATLRDCCFFLIVDPSLVFPNRAVEARTDRRVALVRCAIGISFLLLQAVLFALLELALGASRLDKYGTFMGYHVGILVAALSAASGRASLDIGLFGLLGLQIAERYDYPLAAPNVIAFWRRWNRYVGNWFRAYVFGPVALSTGRQLGRRRLNLAKASAVIGTFALAGGLHDLSMYMRLGRPFIGGTAAFLVNGLAVVLWFVCTQRLSWLPDRFAPGWKGTAGKVAGAAFGVVAYALFVHVLVATTWLVTSGALWSSPFALL